MPKYNKIDLGGKDIYKISTNIICLVSQMEVNRSNLTCKIYLKTICHVYITINKFISSSHKRVRMNVIKAVIGFRPFREIPELQQMLNE